MDGVIVDTMDLHFSAAEEVLNEAGANATKEKLKKFDTTRSSDAFAALLKGSTKAEVDAIVAKKYSRLFKRTKGIKSIDGFPEFFSKVGGKFRLAIVSSSISSFVEHILRELGIRKYFSAVIGGDMIAKGKPDPEGYLKAAGALGVDASECVVIEDSIYGVKSAKSAGMKVIAVTNTYEKNFLLDADLIVDSLAGLAIKDLEALFGA